MKFTVRIVAPQRDAHPDTTPSAQKFLLSLAVPAEPEETFEEVWYRIQERYDPKNYSPHRRPLDANFSKLQDAQGGDILVSDTVGSLYRADAPFEDLVLYMHLSYIDREDTLPPNSGLRPRNFRKRRWDDFSPQELESAKRQRREVERYGKPLAQLNAHTPIQSMERVNVNGYRGETMRSASLSEAVATGQRDEQRTSSHDAQASSDVENAPQASLSSIDYNAVSAARDRPHSRRPIPEVHVPNTFQSSAVQTNPSHNRQASNSFAVTHCEITPTPLNRVISGSHPESAVIPDPIISSAADANDFVESSSFGRKTPQKSPTPALVPTTPKSAQNTHNGVSFVSGLRLSPRISVQPWRNPSIQPDVRLVEDLTVRDFDNHEVLDDLHGSTTDESKRCHRIENDAINFSANVLSHVVKSTEKALELPNTDPAQPGPSQVTAVTVNSTQEDSQEVQSTTQSTPRRRSASLLASANGKHGWSQGELKILAQGVSENLNAQQISQRLPPGGPVYRTHSAIRAQRRRLVEYYEGKNNLCREYGLPPPGSSIVGSSGVPLIRASSIARKWSDEEKANIRRAIREGLDTDEARLKYFPDRDMGPIKKQINKYFQAVVAQEKLKKSWPCQAISGDNWDDHDSLKLRRVYRDGIPLRNALMCWFRGRPHILVEAKWNEYLQQMDGLSDEPEESQVGDETTDAVHSVASQQPVMEPTPVRLRATAPPSTAPSSPLAISLVHSSPSRAPGQLQIVQGGAQTRLNWRRDKGKGRAVDPNGHIPSPSSSKQDSRTVMSAAASAVQPGTTQDVSAAPLMPQQQPSRARTINSSDSSPNAQLSQELESLVSSSQNQGLPNHRGSAQIDMAVSVVRPVSGSARTATAAPVGKGRTDRVTTLQSSDTPKLAEAVSRAISTNAAKNIPKAPLISSGRLNRPARSPPPATRILNIYRGYTDDCSLLGPTRPLPVPRQSSSALRPVKTFPHPPQPHTDNECAEEEIPYDPSASQPRHEAGQFIRRTDTERWNLARQAGETPEEVRRIYEDMRNDEDMLVASLNDDEAARNRVKMLRARQFADRAMADLERKHILAQVDRKGTTADDDADGAGDSDGFDADTDMINYDDPEAPLIPSNGQVEDLASDASEAEIEDGVAQSLPRVSASPLSSTDLEDADVASRETVNTNSMSTSTVLPKRGSPIVLISPSNFSPSPHDVPDPSVSSQLHDRTIRKSTSPPIWMAHTPHQPLNPASSSGKKAVRYSRANTSAKAMAEIPMSNGHLHDERSDSDGDAAEVAETGDKPLSNSSPASIDVSEDVPRTENEDSTESRSALNDEDGTESSSASGDVPEESSEAKGKDTLVPGSTSHDTPAEAPDINDIADSNSASQAPFDSAPNIPSQSFTRINLPAPAPAPAQKAPPRASRYREKSPHVLATTLGSFAFPPLRPLRGENLGQKENAFRLPFDNDDLSSSEGENGSDS